MEFLFVLWLLFGFDFTPNDGLGLEAPEDSGTVRTMDGGSSFPPIP